MEQPVSRNRRGQRLRGQGRIRVPATIESIDEDEQTAICADEDGATWEVSWDSIEPDEESEADEEEEDDEEESEEEDEEEEEEDDGEAEWVPSKGEEAIYKGKEVEILTVNSSRKTVTAKYVKSGNKIKGTIAWTDLE